MVAAVTDSLIEVLAVAEGLDLPAALNRALDTAINTTGARYGALGLYGANGAVTDFFYRGISDEQRRRIGPLPRGRGLLGMMADRLEPVRVDTIGTHPQSVGFPAHHPPMTSFLGVPVVIGQEVYGSLYLTDKQDGPFTADDERIVVALAAATAVAVRNYRAFERTQQRERWQRASTAIDYAVLGGADPGEVLELIAAEARRLSGADVALIALPNSRRRLHLEVVDVRNEEVPPDAWSSVDRSRRGLRSDDSHLREVRSWLGRECDSENLMMAAFNSGQTMLAPGFVGGPASSEAGNWADFGTTVAIPMRVPDRSLGVLGLLWDYEFTRFNETSWEVAEAFAAQAAVTLVLAEARQEHERLTVFEDRDRIARDMHDLVVQRVFATGMSLQGSLREEGIPDSVRARIEQAVADLNETIQEIRHTIFELQHTEARHPGVRTRLLREVAQASVLLGFTPGFSAAGPVDALRGPATDHLVAALREALSNAARHAHPTVVTATLVVSETEVTLTVVDNGVGLPRQVTRQSGIANLAARADELGGLSSLTNGADGGAVFIWQVPR